jgi:hypothetical protein
MIDSPQELDAMKKKSPELREINQCLTPNRFAWGQLSERVLSPRLLRVVIAVFAISLPTLPQAIGQENTRRDAATWVQPRTPDGQPDLQGVWTNTTLTPLERPSEFADKAFLTPKEAEEYTKRTLEKSNKDLQQENTDYNELWTERATSIADGRRTSLIIDPPNGRIPSLTPEAQKSESERAEFQRQHPADGPESLDLSTRCIMRLDTSANHSARPVAGIPMLPDNYDSNTQIVQGPGYVVILQERIHDARVVPLDGAPHLPPSIRSYLGDPRGHWEGNTLVVDSTNFTEKYNFKGSGRNLHLVERFTRIDAKTISYEFTMDDPGVFTKPWTAQIPLRMTEGPLYEYACHEGNYGLAGTLAGARAEEEKASKQAVKSSTK